MLWYGWLAIWMNDDLAICRSLVRRFEKVILNDIIIQKNDVHEIPNSEQ